MTFKRFLLAPVLLAAMAMPAWAEKISLNALSRYINGLSKVETSFTQINADGTISTGTIYISRPYKARFEYNPPEEALVVVGSQRVAIFDGRSNTGPEQYPLKQTPLNLILGRNVNLGTANMVLGHEFDGTATSVLAQDPEHPEYGTIELMFTGPVVELRQWVITDSAGDKTTVILGQFEENPSLKLSLFSIDAEIRKRQR
jgi:outer membrane lipoprotein-sorting protein